MRAIYKKIVLRCSVAVLLIQLACNACYAQKAIDTLNVNEQKEYPIEKFIKYYGDTALLPISSIIQKQAEGLFRPILKKTLNEGFTNKYYWICLNVNNRQPTVSQLVWLFINNTVNEMEVFKISDGKIISIGKTGDHFSFSQRPRYFYLFSYPLELKPGEHATYYAFINKKGENLKMYFRLMESKRFEQFESNTYFTIGLMAGILVLVLLFNIFLFISLKDTIHGWYVLYVISTLLQLLAFEGMDFQLFYPNYPPLNDIAKFLTCGLNLFLMVVVMQQFLNQKRTNSRYYSLTNFVKWLCLLLAITSIPVYKLFSSMQLKQGYTISFCLMAIAGMLVITLTAIERVRQGFKPAYFYLFALTPLFLGSLEFILNLFGLITTFQGTPNRIQSGVVIETVIISFGILYRYNLFKKEKEKLSSELEDQKIQTAAQIIAAQENERKRIAEDLHDELGGDLAAIKMNMQKLSINKEELAPLMDLLDKASNDVRYISHNLMPIEFAETKLKDIMTNYYIQLNNEATISFHFYMTGADTGFNKSDELMIYRIIIELTNNVLKHSMATEATIQLISYNQYLQIIAEDNGKGIQQKDPEGIGLKNIQSRVLYLNGELSIDSNSFGTTVIIQIPYKK